MRVLSASLVFALVVLACEQAPPPVAAPAAVSTSPAVTPPASERPTPGPTLTVADTAAPAALAPASFVREMALFVDEWGQEPSLPYLHWDVRHWRGPSQYQFLFYGWELDTVLRVPVGGYREHEGATFILSKSKYLRLPVYIGQAGDLYATLHNPATIECARQHGAKWFEWRPNESAALRQLIVDELIDRYEPPCNKNEI